MTNRQLIEDNMALVTFCIKKYYSTFLLDEDISQCGMLGLCKAADTWDETKGAFSSYASVCIRNAIRYELRNRKKHKGVLSLEYEYKDDGDVVELKDMIAGDDDIDYVDLESIYNRFTPFEKKIFEYRKLGATTVDIAKQLGCSQSNVSRTLRKMQRKWKLINGDD